MKKKLLPLKAKENLKLIASIPGQIIKNIAGKNSVIPPSVAKEAAALRAKKKK